MPANAVEEETKQLKAYQQDFDQFFYSKTEYTLGNRRSLLTFSL